MGSSEFPCHTSWSIVLKAKKTEFSFWQTKSAPSILFECGSSAQMIEDDSEVKIDINPNNVLLNFILTRGLLIKNIALSSSVTD